MEQLLADAIHSGAWYPILGVAITIVVTLFKRFQPLVFAMLPTRWQWAPAALLASLGAFAVSYEQGDGWLVAVIGAVTAALTAIGAHHTAKRAVGPK